jgi:hypothetical protein
MADVGLLSRTGMTSLILSAAFTLLALQAPRVEADEVSAAIEAATKAAGEARKAADAALAAARASATSGEAAKAALAAAEAAQAAASASQRALEAARTAPSSAPSAGAATAVASVGDAPYEGHVQCTESDGRKECKIDLWMTRGFRAFSQCQVCHGLDAKGSSFAPGLTAKLREIDRERFIEVVTNGFKGQIGVMPPWKENPNVMKYMDQLYGYLKARSDNVIPAGKLKRYDR